MAADASKPSRRRPRLGVVIPALNAAARLPATLASLAEGEAVFDLDILVADGGSTDDTGLLAGICGARVIQAPAGRGHQLVAGAAASRGDWVMFLHADTALQEGWAREAAAFTADPANRGRAGYWRFALDDHRREARLLEAAVALRCRLLALPYGDQGLLLSRALYDSVGGFRPMPLMEDVDLVDRLGRARLVGLTGTARTGAERFVRDGYGRRSLRNLGCLALYRLGVTPGVIARIYG